MTKPPRLSLRVAGTGRFGALEQRAGPPATPFRFCRRLGALAARVDEIDDKLTAKNGASDPQDVGNVAGRIEDLVLDTNARMHSLGAGFRGLSEAIKPVPA
jgi:hypothetical protein